MHSSRPVVDMIGNPSGDQMITCGVGRFFLESNNETSLFLFYSDLIVRIWRVYPYSTESLAVVRSIFCAMPPVHLGIVKNFLSVGFRDEPTLTHSLMLYNLESNGRTKVHRQGQTSIIFLLDFQNDLIIFQVPIMAIE